MLLDKYYSEIRDENGELNRVAIIPTNSCTNIKTYANLKFINRGYLKNNFLMIRDSDGHDPDKLKQDLCDYYYHRIKDDDAKIPRILPDNVLVLKYYSIENYFLNPVIMTELGIIGSVEESTKRCMRSSSSTCTGSEADAGSSRRRASESNPRKTSGRTLKRSRSISAVITSSISSMASTGQRKNSARC